MVSDAPRPTGAAPASAATLWLAGLTAGLLTGFGEVLYHVWRTQTRTSDGLGAHVAWMAPLSNLLWFLPLAGLLVLLRRRIPLPVAIGLLAGLLTLCLLYLRPRLYDLTALLIATGVGVQAARLTRSRTAGVARGVRRLAPALLGLVVLAGGVVGFREWRAERRAVAALPAAGGKTNVLLLVLDTVRAMELSVYGFERPTTPGMEKWAREGVVFERAFSTSPWTLPGHASLFTGRWAHELSARWDRPLDGTTPTLAEALRDRGYLTGGFIANLLYVSRDWGLGRGFAHYEDHPFTPGEFVVSSSLGRKLTGIKGLRRLLDNHEMSGRKSAGDLHRSLLAWLDRKPEGRPFFAFLNYYDAHQPYLPEAAWDAKFATGTQPRAHNYHYYLHEVGYDNRHKFTPEEFAREREAYQATIAYVDHQIDSLLTALQARGILDQTLVIITSDHGEHFGEFGLKGHGNSLYTQLTHVPLLVRYPAALPAGARVAQPVSLRDVPAMVLELTGAPAGTLPGRSLLRFFGPAPDTTPEPVLMSVERENGDFYRAIAHGRDHLVEMTKGGGFFDLYADPLETADRSADSTLAGRRAELVHLLDSLLPVPPRKGKGAR